MGGGRQGDAPRLHVSTQEGAAEVATATEQQTEVMFLSRHGALRLPRVKQHMRADALGQQFQHVFFQDENGRDVSRKVYEFDNGTLTLKPGVDVFPDGPGGSEQDAITWLRAHPEYNGKFHEHGREPDRPTPTDEDFHKALRHALVALDADMVTGMLKTERETHQRPALLTAADQTRKEILQLRRDLEKE